MSNNVVKKRADALSCGTAVPLTKAEPKPPSKQPNRNRPRFDGPRFWRLPAVLEFCGYGRTKLNEEIKLGRFPKPVRLVEGGRAIAWDEEELLNWRKARLAARDAEVA